MRQTVALLLMIPGLPMLAVDRALDRVLMTGARGGPVPFRPQRAEAYFSHARSSSRP